MTDSFEKQVSNYRLPLLAFAVSLCRSVERGEDLVQETMCRALAHKTQFKEGTVLGAWLFTILRNTYHTEWRKLKRETEIPKDDATALQVAAGLFALPNQLDALELTDVVRTLDKLSPEHRAVIIEIAGFGCSYEDAAKNNKVPIGTIKSRVNRARSQLKSLRGA